MNYHAWISWKSQEPNPQYLRDHVWTFDAGISISASASPHIVDKAYVGKETVDPEEAFIASIASCHMLWFLHLATNQNYWIRQYGDQVKGTMVNGENGFWLKTIKLHPQVDFWPEATPDQLTFEQLHKDAHQKCFLAKSVRSQIRIYAQIGGRHV